MRAWVLESPRPIATAPLKLRELERPRVGLHEVLVRVTACGICRTDLHVIEGELPRERLPLVPGHQVVGVVEERGSGCSRLSIGSRVGIAWLRHTCGSCEYCRAGSENLCPASRYTGYHADGGFGEYAVVDEAFAYPLPDAISDTNAAPLLCAGIIGFRALRRSGVRPGQRLAIYGFGSSAHLTIQVARHWGCEVFVATRGEKHQRFARELGAVWAGELDAPLPTGVDSAIIFAPLGELVPIALSALRKGGTLALAGIYMTPVPELDYRTSLFNERTVTSVEANTREDGHDFLKLAAEIPLRPTVREFRFTEVNDALLALKNGAFEGTGVLRGW